MDTVNQNNPTEVREYILIHKIRRRVANIAIHLIGSTPTYIDVLHDDLFTYICPVFNVLEEQSATCRVHMETTMRNGQVFPRNFGCTCGEEDDDDEGSNTDSSGAESSSAS